MADQNYEIEVRTTRQGDAVRQETADLKQLNAETERAAAAAVTLTERNTALAVSERAASDARKERLAALRAGTVQETPRIIDVSSGPGPGGYIDTAGNLQQVEKAAAGATQAVQLTIGAVNTASTAFALTAQNVKAAAAATQINTVEQLENVAATEGVTAAELEKYAATVASTAATEASTVANVENAESANLLSVNARGLGAGVSRLGSQLLGLGGLGRAIFNPMILGVIVLVDLYSKARDALKAWNEELDKQGEAAARPEFKAGMDARRESMEKARLEAEAYADRLRRIVDPEREIMEMYTRQISLERERAAAMKSASDAQEGVEAARLKNLHQEGIVSTDQYYLRLEELQRRHIARQLEIDKEADRKEVELKQAQLDRVSGRVGDADKVVAAKRAAADSTGVKTADDEATLKTLEGKSEELKKRARETTEALSARWTGVPDEALPAVETALNKKIAGQQLTEMERGVLDANPQASVAFDEYIKAHGNLNANEGAINKLKPEVQAERSVSAQAQRDLDRAERVAEEARSQTQKLTDEVADLKARLGVKEQASAAVAKSKTEEEAAKAVGAIEQSSPQAKAEVGAFRAAAVAVENARAGGKPISPDERDLITRIASLAQGKQVSYADAVKYVQDLAKSDDALLQAIKAITDRRNTLNLKGGDAGAQFEGQLGQVVATLNHLLGGDVAAAGRGLMPTRTGNVTPRPGPAFDFNQPGAEHIKELADQYTEHMASFKAVVVAAHGKMTKAMVEQKKDLERQLDEIHKEITDSKLH